MLEGIIKSKNLKMNLKNLKKNKSGKILVNINIIFIFLFLNVWDYVISREFFNAMALGIIMFGPAILFWFIGNIRAIALLTLISIFEFTVMAVFVLEGFELGGIALKSVFWVPFLLMAFVNGFWGLKVYSEYKEKVIGSKA